MKKKQYNIPKIFVCLLLVIGLSSCDEGGDPDPGATQVVEMAGDWYVETLLDGDVVLGYVQLSTYNTAADDGTEMWIDDHGNIWPFKVKCPVNTSSLTFSGDALDNEPNDITVTISNGLIEKDGAVSSGGNTVDGISFDIEFSDDPGTVYHIEGYKRTGLLEDEH